MQPNPGQHGFWMTEWFRQPPQKQLGNKHPNYRLANKRTRDCVRLTSWTFQAGSTHQHPWQISNSVLKGIIRVGWLAVCHITLKRYVLQACQVILDFKRCWYTETPKCLLVHEREKEGRFLGIFSESVSIKKLGRNITGLESTINILH